MKTLMTLALLALAATALAPSASADTFVVSVSAGGETVSVQQDAPAGCGHYRYQTAPGSPVQSYGGGNGNTCTSHTSV